MATYLSLVAKPPLAVPWSEVVEFDRLDERLSSIDCLYANILGVNDGEVEWCPNEDPPSRDEKLAWLWFIRPDLSLEIEKDAPEELRYLMESYRNGTMEDWRRRIAG